MRAFLHKKMPGSSTVKTTQVILPDAADSRWPLLVIWDHQLWVFQEDIVDHAHYIQANAVKPTDVIT